MGRHVVVSLQYMVVEWLTFRYDIIKYLLRVASYIRIGIFVDGQTATGVLYKQIQQSCLRWGRQLSHNISCDEVETSAHSVQSYFYLLNHILFCFFYR